MKKTYLIPTIKTVSLPELMQTVVTTSELNPDEFELGGKGMDLEEDEAPLFHIETKSVWED